MTFWNITFYIAAIVSVFLILLLIFRKYAKTKYYHSFSEDILLHCKNEGGVKNYLYSVHSETKKYIEKYIFRKSVYEKSIVVNYNEQFSSISYFVKVFNNRNKVIQIIEVNDYNTKVVSKIIFLCKEAKKVNILIKEVNGLMINEFEVVPVPKRNITIFSFIISTLFFSVNYVIRHLVAYFILGNQFRPFLYNLNNYLIIGVSFIFAIIILIVTNSSLIKKNWKKRNGGAIQYEFL